MQTPDPRARRAGVQRGYLTEELQRQFAVVLDDIEAEKRATRLKLMIGPTADTPQQSEKVVPFLPLRV